MKTKANSAPSGSRSHSKRSSSSRERDRKKAPSGESTTSNQCETPPLNDKEGKFAGISPESVQCMAEQVNAELTSEACSNLAEDVSFKIRQLLHNVALHSHNMKKSKVDVHDVNTVLQLMDTGPVLGAGPPQWVPFGDPENLCTENCVEVDVTELALTPQVYKTRKNPSIAVDWVTDERQAPINNISPALRNYYIKVSQAILNGKEKLIDIALHDLATNLRIGPIIPNLFNLAVLVLNDDNLSSLSVAVTIPIQVNILNMIDALCLNPCSEDSNILPQLQRMFPFMVSNILGNGPLADQMVKVLGKITHSWPGLAFVGNGILYQYLLDEKESKLSPAYIACLVALGRQSLVDCLTPHYPYIGTRIHTQMQHTNNDKKGLLGPMLDAASLLLKPDPNTLLEDFIATDMALYEILGDAILPRRLYRTITDKKIEGDDVEDKNANDSNFPSIKTLKKRQKIKIMRRLTKKTVVRRSDVFEPTNFSFDSLCRPVYILYAAGRPRAVTNTRMLLYNAHLEQLAWRERERRSSVERSSFPVVSVAMLNRFKFRMPKKKVFPDFGMYTI